METTTEWVPVLDVLKPTILSFRGRIGSGKSTAAQHLTKKFSNVESISFADALRVELYDRLVNLDDEMIGLMAQTQYVWSPLKTGVSDAHKISVMKDLKAVDPAMRRLMQFYGTDYRRAQDENYWLDKWLIKAKAALEAEKMVVVDDARFQNERQAITRLGGYEFFVVRTGVKLDEGIPNHPSEALNDPHDPDIDWILLNNGSESFFEDLMASMRLIRHAQWREDKRIAGSFREGGNGN